ncbi:MAG: TonB-dependent siderophore receptor [Acetobacter papayae]
MKHSGLACLVVGLSFAAPSVHAAEKEEAAPALRSSEAKLKAGGGVSAAHGAKQAPVASTDDEQVMVRGRRASTVASSATKTDTPLVDTAQSVTVITRNEMDVRGVLSLNQAVRYAAGITQDQRGSTATRYDMFALRGFSVPTFLDGLKLQSSPTGYATAQTDTSRLDRIEILKGPASALYGQSSPGGLVALSSKLPTEARSYGGVAATGGSFDLYRVDADVGGWATDNGMVRYRIYGTANGSHSQLTKTGSRRFSISPAFTFGGDGPTTLTLLGNYQYDPTNASYGSVPRVGSLVSAPYGKLPRDFYDGDTGYEQFKRKQGAITYIFTHHFDKDWSFTSRGRYDDVSTAYQSVYSLGTYASPTELERGTFGTNERMHNLAFDNQFRGHVNTGPVHHTLMAGFDYQQSTASELARSGSAPTLNVLNPVYGVAIATPGVYANYDTHQQQYGVYAQDELRIGSLYLTGSLRNDWYTAQQNEYIGGSATDQSASQITFRASGLYHFKFGLSPYISYSTSFQPQSGIVSDNGGLSTRQANPSLGKQLEGGVKYQIPGTPVLLTAAGFHIEQTNVLVSVPNTAYSTESGKVHSDGFEFEAHVDVYKNLMVVAAFSSQSVHDDSTGKPLVQSGKGNASLFAFYTMPSGPVKGLGFGGGLRYSAKVYGGTVASGDVTVPSYVVFDGSLRYDLSQLSPSLKGWSAAASVRNLFDKNYVASCYTEWCWYGERRNAQATIGYSW